MMRLGYFTMPVHPLHRSLTETLREDREAIILADKLGFYDAFMGEHLTDAAENIANSMLFLATLIPATRDIRLGTGTANLSHSHPVLIATHAAMFDHLAEGRFIFGISPGSLSSDREVLGILNEDGNKMFVEAINVILAIWERDPPYEIDFPENRYKVSTAQSYDPTTGVGVMPKPYQKPYPEVVATVVAPFSQGVVAMGERDFHPLSANFLLPQWVKTHWDNYAKGKKNVGKTANPADWRIARTIFVADDDKTAAAYGRYDAASPYRFYYQQIKTKLEKAKRHGVFKTHKDQPDEEVTLDFVLEKLVLWGSVNKVVDEILKFHEQVGDFGELVYAGMDWVDPTLGKRSLELMATEVMPRVNAALGRSEAAK
jgi:alkanesulfonate monooxygenase SsuD/methylene tetrahydromethanopterin reductase-like flavin-dependent oxidoreductase (luciferase family)